MGIQKSLFTWADIVFMVSSVICFSGKSTLAQNPIILDQFTADPSARIFGDKVYVYPSHDIAGIEGKGRKGWFCMEEVKQKPIR